MKEFFVRIRNWFWGGAYRLFFKPIVFKLDPEKVHDRMIGVGKLLGGFFLFRWLTAWSFNYQNKILEQKVAGLKFKNPVGLAAGFDKNAELLKIIPEVGFGFEEIGSITGMECAGNAKPRLWRLPKSKSLVVYYGLKNDGAEAISLRLKKWWASRRKDFIVGISLAKTNCKETVETGAGIEDYLKGYLEFKGLGDYFTINISCPNAFGGEPFTDPVKLEKLLTALDPHYQKGKPVFLKISPDIGENGVEEVVKVALKHQVDGFICTNLTKRRDLGQIVESEVPKQGGLSGKVVDQLSDKMIEEVYRLTKGEKVIIGVGGVFSAEDAYRKIKKGANLIQLITGMIFQGPQTVSAINLGLVKLLKKDGFRHLSEAVGTENY